MEISEDVLEELLNLVKRLQKKYPTTKIFFQGEKERYRGGVKQKTSGNQKINILTIGLDKKGKPKAGHMMRKEYDYLEDPEVSKAMAQKDLVKFNKAIQEDIIAKMNGKPTTSAPKKKLIIKTIEQPAVKGTVPKVMSPEQMREFILKQQPKDVKMAEIRLYPELYEAGGNKKFARMTTTDNGFSKRLLEGMKGFTKDQITKVFNELSSRQ